MKPRSTVTHGFLSAVCLIFATHSYSQESAQSDDDAVFAQGEIIATERVVIRNDTDFSLAIISLVPEGQYVNAGDVVLVFDDALVKDKLEEQKILAASAEQELKLLTSQNASNTRNLEAQRKLLIDKKKGIAVESEYLFGEAGEFQLETAKLIRKKEFAKKKRELLQARAAAATHTQREELEIQLLIMEAEHAIENADASVEHIQKQLIPFRRNELEQREQEIELQLTTIDRELNKTNTGFAAELVAKETSLRLENEKLVYLVAELEACSVRAPSKGKVVYQSSRVGEIMEEGAMIRPGQTVLYLPNLDKLQMEVLVAEADVTKVRVGQDATIHVDALADRELRGSVVSISPYPRPDWKEGRKYEVQLSVVELPDEIRIRMTGEAKIDVRQ